MKSFRGHLLLTHLKSECVCVLRKICLIFHLVCWKVIALNIVANFVERYILSPLNRFVVFVVNQLNINMSEIQDWF